MKEIGRALGPIARRIANMLARGVVSLANSAGKMQVLQVALLAEESKDAVEHFEPYGFTSNPQPGAEVVAAFLDGDRSHGIVLCAADRRYRVTGLQSGEVAIYTDEGDKIVLKRGHAVEIDTHTLTINATTKVQINSPLLQVTGGDVKADAISLKTHVHGGVQAGSGNTGAPV